MTLSEQDIAKYHEVYDPNKEKKLEEQRQAIEDAKPVVLNKNHELVIEFLKLCNANENGILEFNLKNILNLSDRKYATVKRDAINYSQPKIKLDRKDGRFKLVKITIQEKL